MSSQSSPAGAVPDSDLPNLARISFADDQHSTPLRVKGSIANHPNVKQTKEILEPTIKEDLKQDMAVVSVEKWIDAVCDVAPDEFEKWIDYIKKQKLFEEPEIQKNLRLFSSCKETDRYVPLCDILNRMREFALEATGDDLKGGAPFPIPNTTYFRNDPKYMRRPGETEGEVNKLAAQRKPDILLASVDIKTRFYQSAGEKVTGAEWTDVLETVELKYTKKLMSALNLELTLRNQRPLAGHSQSEDAGPGKDSAGDENTIGAVGVMSSMCSNLTDGVSSSLGDVFSNDADDNGGYEDTPTNGGKRGRTAGSDSPAVASGTRAAGSSSRTVASGSRTGGSQKKPRTTQKPEKQRVQELPQNVKVQAASYAFEILGSTKGTRLHTIGVILSDDRVSLWYYDACGIVRTKQVVSLISDFEKVSAIFIALAYCTPEQRGALPNVLTPPESSQFPPRTLEGYTIDLVGKVDTPSGEEDTSADKVDTSAKKEDTSADKEGHRSDTERTPSKEEVPSSDHKDTSPATEDTITIGQHIFSQRAIVGRRTSVHRGTTSSEPLKIVAVKLSFQFAGRISEATLVQEAHDKGVGHLPIIYKSKDLWKASDGIRGRFGVEYEDRILRVVVSELLTPAYEYIAEHADSLPVMADHILQCVHDLRYNALILQRDISEGNIMYKMVEGEPYFILNDFDLAVRVNEDGSPKGNTSTHRTGTVPYMAADLLWNLVEARMAAARGEKPNGISHRLRFDYESVFWVSLGFGVKLLPADTPDKTRKEQERYEQYLAALMKEDAWGQKRAVLQGSDVLISLLKNLSEPFMHLKVWFMAFQSVFRRGYAALGDWNEEQAMLEFCGKDLQVQTPVEKETHFGRVTLDTIRAAIDLTKVHNRPPVALSA